MQSNATAVKRGHIPSNVAGAIGVASGSSVIILAILVFQVWRTRRDRQNTLTRKENVAGDAKAFGSRGSESTAGL